MDNDRVLAYLQGRAAARFREQPIVRVDEPTYQHYWNHGAHPDIVQRLWEQLGAALPAGCRALVFGTPALVDPGSSEVIAFAVGMQYVLRLPARLLGDGRPPGLRTVATWSNGKTTDIAQECGEEWIFGTFEAAEAPWCRETLEDQRSPSGQ